MPGLGTCTRVRKLLKRLCGCRSGAGNFGRQMATKKILIHPDPVLRKTADSVLEVDDGLRQLARDMLETMYGAPGIGLAAPQVGKSVRLLVMDCAWHLGNAERNPVVLCNPEVMSESEEQNTRDEGCLSIPGETAEVTRPSDVRVSFLDMDGQSQERDFSGLWATCVQHEIDHLNGKLFIDYLSPLKRRLVTDKMKKLKRERRRNPPPASGGLPNLAIVR